MQATVKTVRKSKVISFQDFQDLIRLVINLDNTSEFKFESDEYYYYVDTNCFISYSATRQWTVRKGREIVSGDYLVDAIG